MNVITSRTLNRSTQGVTTMKKHELSKQQLQFINNLGGITKTVIVPTHVKHYVNLYNYNEGDLRFILSACKSYLSRLDSPLQFIKDYRKTTYLLRRFPKAVLRHPFHKKTPLGYIEVLSLDEKEEIKQVLTMILDLCFELPTYLEQEARSIFTYPDESAHMCLDKLRTEIRYILEYGTSPNLDIFIPTMIISAMNKNIEGE